MRASIAAWRTRTGSRNRSSRCRGPPGRARADVIVIGGGVTGCSCALTLAEAGVRVRLLEARKVASGASGRNGGFALRGAAMAYDVAREQLGREAAGRLWRLTEAYLERLGALAGDAFRRVGSLRLAADEAERASLRAEHDALREDGFAVEWLDELPDRWQAATTARSCTRATARSSLRAGCGGWAAWPRRPVPTCASDTRVDSLASLDADHVVVATDGYGQGLLPALDAVVTPTRGQVVVTEPLERLLFDRPHYARHHYDYWQQTPDRRLVAGGRRDAALELENTSEEVTTEAIQRELERSRRTWPGSRSASPIAGPGSGARRRMSCRW